MRYLYAIMMLLLTGPAAWAASPQVKIELKWEYKNFTLPVTLYEMKGHARLWETRSVANPSDAPIGERMQSTELLLEPGQDKRFVLVVQNPSDQKLYFFAAPHVVQPPEEALGFKFKCLCVNRAYIVGPHETWYRVVEFRLSPDFAGQGLTVMHTIIGIDQKRADAFSKDPVIPEF